MNMQSDSPCNLSKWEQFESRDLKYVQFLYTIPYAHESTELRLILGDLEAADKLVLEHTGRIVLGGYLAKEIDVSSAVAAERALGFVRIVAVEPRNIAALGLGVLLQRFRESAQLFLHDLFVLLCVNGTRQQPQKCIIRDGVQSKHVATLFHGTFGKKGWKWLEQALRYKVLCWKQCFELLHQLVMQFAGLLNDIPIVLEGQGEPGLPIAVSYIIPRLH